MKLKIKIFAILVCLSLTVSLTSHTYSRYVADSSGSIELEFAKWKILVNNSDITNQNITSIDLTPVVIANENVAQNKFAPSSEGYFDIIIDASDTDVSFDYEVTMEVLNENIPDLLISKYTIIDASKKESAEQIIKDKKILGTVKYQKGKVYEPFTIRVYFEWYDGETATMSDDMDTLIGTSSDDNTLRINANVKFTQNISNTSTISDDMETQVSTGEE